MRIFLRRGAGSIVVALAVMAGSGPDVVGARQEATPEPWSQGGVDAARAKLGSAEADLKKLENEQPPDAACRAECEIAHTRYLATHRNYVEDLKQVAEARRRQVSACQVAMQADRAAADASAKTLANTALPAEVIRAREAARQARGGCRSARQTADGRERRASYRDYFDAKLAYQACCQPKPAPEGTCAIKCASAWERVANARQRVAWLETHLEELQAENLSALASQLSGLSGGAVAENELAKARAELGRAEEAYKDCCAGGGFPKIPVLGGLVAVPVGVIVARSGGGSPAPTSAVPPTAALPPSAAPPGNTAAPPTGPAPTPPVTGTVTLVEGFLAHTFSVSFSSGNVDGRYGPGDFSKDSDTCTTAPIIPMFFAALDVSGTGGGAAASTVTGNGQGTLTAGTVAMGSQTSLSIANGVMTAVMSFRDIGRNCNLTYSAKLSRR